MTEITYDPLHEWENFSFPIEITELIFEKNLYQLEKTCVVTIWRDENLNLKGNIQGYSLNPKLLSENRILKEEGNFAESEMISGRTSSGLILTLRNCIVGNRNIVGLFYPNLGIPFNADLQFDDFTQQKFSESSSSRSRYDWYMCASSTIFFPFCTSLYKVGEKTIRIREGIDQHSHEKTQFVGGRRDFLLVSHPNFKCIVSSVSKEFSVSWALCICFEYRQENGVPNEEEQKSVENFMGFLFGTELVRIGSTEFLGNGDIRQKAFNPSNNNLKHFCRNAAMPPIRLNAEYEWSQIQVLVDKLFPTYLQNNSLLDFDGVLWRFFRAKELAVGIDLPVLSSALEILASKYLRVHTVPSEYISEAEFNSLVGCDILNIEEKLVSVEGASVILSKIKNSFKRGPNEKLELFFSSIKLPIGKLERKAIQTRNSMAHGGSLGKSDNEAKKLILLRKVYLTLFHRVLLRILEYDGYYIDHYLTGKKSKKLTTEIGTAG